jgi:hypothetical protein
MVLIILMRSCFESWKLGGVEASTELSPGGALTLDKANQHRKDE